jgi:hypothetical protein
MRTLQTQSRTWNGHDAFRVSGLENSLISELPARAASPLSPLSRRSTILQLQHGIDSEHKWSRI